jgi:hypothetical protein
MKYATGEGSNDETGPNDARRVVWAITSSKFSFLSFRVLLILIIIFRYY